jgi:hypothetical protein
MCQKVTVDECGKLADMWKKRDDLERYGYRDHHETRGKHTYVETSSQAFTLRKVPHTSFSSSPNEL